VLALAAKEMAVTLPLVCVAYERFVRRRVAAGRAPATPGATVSGRLVLGAAGIGMVAALVALRSYGRFFRRVIGITVWHGGTIGTNFATVARVWAHYLGLVFWPAVLTADYSDGAFPVSPSVFDPRALAAGGVLVVVAVLAWRRWRDGGLGGFGAVWCAVTLLPVSHLIPYRELLAEHYLYVPMIGVAFVAADLIESALARFPAYRRSIAAAVVLVLAAATARTIVRNGDWQDKLSLWSATVKAVPGCARAHFNLGHAYFERVRLDDAEREWSAAAALKPNDFDTAMALATVTYREGKLDLATARVESALALRPGHTAAQVLAGWVALDRGEPERAIAYFDAALEAPRGDGAHGAEPGRERALAVIEARKRPRPVGSEEDHR
jgi:hypothetical protein